MCERGDALRRTPGGRLRAICARRTPCCRRAVRTGRACASPDAPPRPSNRSRQALPVDARWRPPPIKERGPRCAMRCGRHAPLEAQAVIPVRGIVVVAVRCARVVPIVVPGPATHHTTDLALLVFLSWFVVPVCAPFPDATAQVQDPLRGGALRIHPDRRRATETALSSVCASLVPVGSPRVGVLEMSSRCGLLPLPLPLERQTDLDPTCADSQRQNAVASNQETFSAG